MNVRMIRFGIAAAMLGVVLCGARRAEADLLYDNGPINATIDAYTINFGFSVSNSFTLTSASNLNGAQLGIWAFPSDSLTGVDWSIGTTPFAADLASGTASTGNAFQFTNAFGYDIYESSFSLAASLTAGTYYLTIQNATTNAGDPIYWDVNNGPSTAFENVLGAIPSESFQIFGTAGAVPEPATLMQLGIGAVALIGFARRRNRATA